MTTCTFNVTGFGISEDLWSEIKENLESELSARFWYLEKNPFAMTWQNEHAFILEIQVPKLDMKKCLLTSNSVSFWIKGFVLAKLATKIKIEDSWEWDNKE